MSAVKPGAFGPAAPLPGTKGFKKSQSERLAEETLSLEARLARLRVDMAVEQERRASTGSAGSSSKGNGFWKTAGQTRGSMRNYGKEVKTREREKVTEAQASHAPLRPRRQRPLEMIAMARASEHSRVSQSADSATSRSADGGGQGGRRDSGGSTASPGGKQIGGGFRDRDAGDWSVDDALEWLDMIGLSQHRAVFRDNEISGPILLEVGPDDLDYMRITALAHRKLLLRGIDDLRRNGQPTAVVAPLISAAATVAGSSSSSGNAQVPAPASASSPALDERCRPRGPETTDNDDNVCKAPLPPAPAAAQYRHWSAVRPLADSPAADSGGDVLHNTADGAANHHDGGGSSGGDGGAWKDGGMWSNPFGSPPPPATHVGGGSGGGGGGGDSLLNGAVDEEAEAAAFRRAVGEWRAAGRGGDGVSAGAAAAAASNDSAPASAAVSGGGGGGGTIVTASADAGSCTAASALECVRSIADALARRMDEDHAAAARALAARRRALEAELREARCGGSGGGGGGGCTSGPPTARCREADAAGGDGGGGSGGGSEERQAARSGGEGEEEQWPEWSPPASPLLSEASFEHVAEGGSAAREGEEYTPRALEISVLQSTLGCCTQRGDGGRAEYLVEESSGDDEE